MLTDRERDRLEDPLELFCERLVLDHVERHLLEAPGALGIELRRHRRNQTVLAPDQSVIDVRLEADMAAWRQTTPQKGLLDGLAHSGQQQDEASAFGHLAEPEEADHGRGIEARDAPEIDDQGAKLIDDAVLKSLAQPVR